MNQKLFSTQAALQTLQGFQDFNNQIKSRPSRRHERRGSEQVSISWEEPFRHQPTLNLGLCIGSNDDLMQFLCQFLLARFNRNVEWVHAALGEDVCSSRPSRMTFKGACGPQRGDKLELFASEPFQPFLVVFGTEIDAWVECVAETVKSLGFDIPVEVYQPPVLVLA